MQVCNGFFLSFLTLKGKDAPACAPPSTGGGLGLAGLARLEHRLMAELPGMATEGRGTEAMGGGQGAQRHAIDEGAMVSHRRDACATAMRAAGQAAGRPRRAGKMARKRRGERGRGG